MNTSTLRWIGILFLIAAAVVAILNLRRVAGLGMPWLAPLLIVFGAAFVAFSRRAQKS
jgi:hypothetical protein